MQKMSAKRSHSVPPPRDTKAIPIAAPQKGAAMSLPGTTEK
jgi:hypothetical protein